MDPKMYCKRQIQPTEKQEEYFRQKGSHRRQGKRLTVGNHGMGGVGKK